MEQINNVIGLNDFKEKLNQSWGYATFAHVKIEDKENNRFTDCWVIGYVKNGRVYFVLQHEKGYPSENKGSASKTIRANWISHELPKH